MIPARDRDIREGAIRSIHSIAAIKERNNMKIKTEAFKHGLRNIVLEASIEGEASGRMLFMATESVKTSVAGALDAAGKRLAVGNLTGEAKKKVQKDFTREGYFASEEAVKLAAAAFRAPEHIADVVIVDAGKWEGMDSSANAKLHAQAQAMYDLLCKFKTPADALKEIQAITPGFTPAGAVEVKAPELVEGATTDEQQKVD